MMCCMDSRLKKMKSTAVISRSQLTNMKKEYTFKIESSQGGVWGAKGEAMWTMGTLVRGLNLLAKVEEGKEGEVRCQQEGKTCLRHNSHLKCSRSSSEETTLE